MRSRAFLLSLALSGCGLVSGLDTLHVGDASADATVDVDVDGARDGGDTIEAAVTDGAGIRCGQVTCAYGTSCCIAKTQGGNTNYTYTCADAGCGTGTTTLQCDDKSDCPTSVAPTCCYNAGSSLCGLSPTTTCIALCNDVSQCTGGSACVPFDAGYGLSLMRCQ